MILKNSGDLKRLVEMIEQDNSLEAVYDDKEVPMSYPCIALFSTTTMEEMTFGEVSDDDSEGEWEDQISEGGMPEITNIRRYVYIKFNYLYKNEILELINSEEEEL